MEVVKQILLITAIVVLNQSLIWGDPAHIAKSGCAEYAMPDNGTRNEILGYLRRFDVIIFERDSDNKFAYKGDIVPRQAQWSDGLRLQAVSSAKDFLCVVHPMRAPKEGEELKPVHSFFLIETNRNYVIELAGGEERIVPASALLREAEGLIERRKSGGQSGNDPKELTSPTSK